MPEIETRDRVAYEAGWRASMRTTTADLDAAEARFEARYGRTFDPCSMFSAGWVDAAVDGTPKGKSLADHLATGHHFEVVR